MLRHVHLSCLACALPQLLTLCQPPTGLGKLLRSWSATPWRGAGAPISVHETQLVLAIACRQGATPEHVPGSNAQHASSIRPTQRPLHAPDGSASAELRPVSFGSR